MTLNEAIATEPLWIQVWLPLLVFGMFVPGLVLLFFKNTRVLAVLMLVTSLLAALGVNWMFDRFGYVRLLGLPHIILWVPMVIYALCCLSAKVLRRWQKIAIWVYIILIAISLVFDTSDVFRYFVLGETAPMVEAAN